ncbi:MAG: DUF1810 domain-containing protein [Oscillospiraceae bacterium]|nr:DUF1810 domain-containing protein [Oscillospiraceae bacterium]
MASDLSRFLKAQEYDYAQALKEIRAGRKRSHWMWYIFPQIQGLGFSSTAQFYAIRDLDEAKDYLAHPILGARLKEISSALLQLEGLSASEIFGYPDDLKLRSSMTLFRLADLKCNIFRDVIDKYYDGKPDSRTVEIVQGMKAR